MREQAEQTHSQRFWGFYQYEKRKRYLVKRPSDHQVTNYIYNKQPEPHPLTLCRKMVLQLRLPLEETSQGHKLILLLVRGNIYMPFYRPKGGVGMGHR